MKNNIEIIIGTYEEFLLGYKLDTKNEKQVLTQSFADKSHSGSLRSVAVHGRWVASGATDDRIFIYDMRSRKQSQILLSHEGTINALAFTPDNTHLLSGGSDGRMIATRLNTWMTEATWKKAHSGTPVTHISCHPSGKLALSLGTDLVLRTWNLVKGRVAYKTNLKSRNTLGLLPDCLAWSLSGDYFTLSGQRVVEIWSIKTADVLRSQKTTSKPICLSWVSDESCLVGLEDGNILWVTLKGEEEKETIIEAHKSRVKAICFSNNVLVTASSSGEVKLWQVNETSRKLKEIASTNIGCRPTCIGILDLEQFGSEYVLTKAIAQKQEKKPKVASKPKSQERGVVTIEYENDDETNNITKDDEDSHEEGEDDEESEDAAESEENEDENDDAAEEDDEVEGEKTSDEDENDTTDEDKEEEPQIRLPKSRKRKQQILDSQKQSKQAKLIKNIKSQQSTGNTKTSRGNGKQKKPKQKQK